MKTADKFELLDQRRTFAHTIVFLLIPYPPKRWWERQRSYDRKKRDHQRQIRKACLILKKKIARIDRKLGFKNCPRCKGRGTLPTITNPGWPGRDYDCNYCAGSGGVPRSPK